MTRTLLLAASALALAACGQQTTKTTEAPEAPAESMAAAISAGDYSAVSASRLSNNRDLA